MYFLLFKNSVQAVNAFCRILNEFFIENSAYIKQEKDKKHLAKGNHIYWFPDIVLTQLTNMAVRKNTALACWYYVLVSHLLYVADSFMDVYS